MPASAISNNSTTPGLVITRALVRINISAETGKTVDDHLKVALQNKTGRPLDQVGVYHRTTDPSIGKSEGYFTKLAGFVIDPGATRLVHIDNTGAPDHYPENVYSLYHTDKNALVVDVKANAPGLKPATFTVKKDSGGAEAGVE